MIYCISTNNTVLSTNNSVLQETVIYLPLKKHILPFSGILIDALQCRELSNNTRR